MELKSIFQTVYSQRFVVTIALFAGITIAWGAAKVVHPTYAATASVLLVPTGDQTDTTPANQGTTSIKPLLSGDLPSLAQTSLVLGNVARDLGNSVDPGQLYGRIRTDVYANSNVMTIRFVASNEDRAKLGANAVADEVVKYYRTIATTRLDSLAADLRREMAIRQHQLRDIDAQVQRLTAAYPYIEDGAGASDSTTINARLVHLQSQRDDLTAALSGDIAQAGVTDERTSEVAPLARQQAANADTSYMNDVSQYGKDAAELRREQTRFSSDYPGLGELQDIVKRENAGLTADMQRIGAQPLSATQSYAEALAEKNRAHSLVAGDRSRLQQIDNSIHELQRELTMPSSIAMSVDALRRERATAEAAYQVLSSRLSVTLADRAAAASTGSLIVYDRALSASRTPYTSPKVIVTALLLMTVWMAITLAFIFEAADRRFRTAAQIESVYGSPVLGATG